MYAKFTYAKIYNSDEFEIIMQPTSRRAPKPRRYAICSNELDAQAIAVALSAVYGMPEQPVLGKVAEYWEDRVRG